MFAGKLGFTFAAPASSGAFGLTEIEVRSLDAEGHTQVEAGSHPDTFETSFQTETEEVPPGSGKLFPLGEPKDLRISFPPGFLGNPSATPRCTAAEFQAGDESQCPNASAVGVARIEYGDGIEIESTESPVYNLYPTPGYPAKFGFIIQKIAPVTIDAAINPNPPYNVIAEVTNASQAAFLIASEVTIWGDPGSPAYDTERGSCLKGGGNCPVSIDPIPFLTLPTDCSEPLTFGLEADPWEGSEPFKGQASIEDESLPAGALSPTECESLEFGPQFSAEPTSSQGGSASGLDANVDVTDAGLVSFGGRASSTIKKTVVTLPEGMTLNPSQANGLGACSEAELARESADSQPGDGCPLNSKVGSVEAETPLLENTVLHGSLYVATPHENPYGSLIALYMVIRDKELGVSVKLPAKVEADPTTGQLTTTLGEGAYPIPQVPVSHFRFHFREGPQSPLVTPEQCGSYEIKASFTPWSDPTSTFEESSSFDVTSGPTGGPCTTDPDPFGPGFEAGSTDNHAGRYSPVFMRLTRSDTEQELTRLSATFPPGLVGKIAGLGRCGEEAIAAAKARTGAQELASPSCPASSQFGRTLAGAGVGEVLTYVPGSLYLAGPYNGAPLSIVAITPAVAGPFDLGTVVVRLALDLNPITAQVEVNGAASDPFPRILQGIPLRLRDLRVYVDRPNFTINPTSCVEESFSALLFGAALDPFSGADDASVQLSDRFQAADCASLSYKPKIALRLNGGTKRTKHPALQVRITPRPGDANLGRAVLSLPKTEFIDNAHISNPCTRPQFAANQCPPGSILGTARATSPLLDEPLEGLLYFRSNGGERLLPDVVVSLHGLFDVVAVGEVRSKKGRITTTFNNLPDAATSKIVISLYGGKKGLLVNNTNLCAKPRRADSKLVGQNGRRLESRPVVAMRCANRKK